VAKRRNDTVEDASLWKQVAETATPLAKKNKNVAGPIDADSKTQTKTKPPKNNSSPPPARQASAAAPPPRPAPPPQDLGAGSAAGLDKRTQQRLKRGQLPIEGRIDLHGLYFDQAQTALADFIERALAANKRCVLVITGKGGRSGGGAGVIREALAGWLGGPGLRASVLAFSRAQPKDGGDGAFYVLLRKR